MNEKKLNYGVRKDLKTDIRYEPNACKGYVLDVSLGCPHHCIYCLFAPLENRVYRFMNPEYKDSVIPLNMELLRKRTKFPPAVYMCYSSDPLANEQLIKLSLEAMDILFENNVSILFITKGIFTDEVLEKIKERPELLNIQIDVSSADSYRNARIEPHAPTYKQRLENIRKLKKIEGLASLSLRMDPLLPNLDDTDENLHAVLNDVSALGIKEIMTGYLILTRNMKNSWLKDQYLSPIAEIMTETTPTISEQELFSIPFDEKIRRLSHMQEICAEYGVRICVCGCKDERYKSSCFEWICHPYNRKKRIELQSNSSMILEYDHMEGNGDE